MNKKIVAVSNNFIRNHDLQGLQDYYAFVSNEYSNIIDASYIFNNIFANACLHNNINIVKWLLEIYERFNPIEKMALKPLLLYTRHQTAQRQQTEIHNLLLSFI